MANDMFTTQWRLGHDDTHLVMLHGIYRRKIEHEDNLINWRTTWFIATQSMLFVTVAMFSDRTYGFQFQMLSSALAFVGLAICVTTFNSVWAARAVISDHVRYWDGMKGVHGHLDLPRLAGSIPGTHRIARGSSSSIFMPIAAALAWVSILTAVWMFDPPMHEVETLLDAKFRELTRPGIPLIERVDQPADWTATP